MAMVMTVLEARVDADQWGTLADVYREGTRDLAPGMVETFLLQNFADRDLWRIATVWDSRQSLNDYRDSVETPGGVLLFREAGAEPELSIFEVASHAPRRQQD